MGKTFGTMAQGDKKTGTKGTHATCIKTDNNIDCIPGDRVMTYARIVIDLRPQKEDSNRVHITSGGNLIKTPGDLITRKADMTTAKILWNIILSIEGAKLQALTPLICTLTQTWNNMSV